MSEVEVILNSRSLTQLSDEPLEPLTPNHHLLLQAGATYPPGLFEASDTYARRRRRQVQYLANLFRKRWSKEYLSQLLVRDKWVKERPNLRVGDLVLMMVENSPRYQWLLARISEDYLSRDGLVRSVKFKTEI